MNHAPPYPAGSAGASVAAPSGSFRGTLRDGVAVFRGIRYAAPPLGDLRFAPPVAAAVAETAVDASASGPISIQDIDPLPLVVPGAEFNFYGPGAVASEDCLNLNVWTPDTTGRAPVLFWIHGGAFLCGSGSGLWTDGTHLARRHGIVVVTINYRLGYLGGLYLGDRDPARSNLALQDMLLALRWVRDNIAAFGGDPDNVTIGGQSAGAMAVSALLVAPAGRGLFRRAFVESGHLDSIIGVDKAQETTAFILDRLGVDAKGDVLGQLRQLSTFRLTFTQRQLGISRRAFPLVGDDITLPSDPMAALAQRADVDVLIGTTMEEDRLFAVTGWAPPIRPIAETLGGYLSEPAARVEAEAFYAELLALRGGDAVALTHLIATEHSWGEPARQLATVHAGAGGRAFHYEFAWASSALEGRVGAAHLVDLPFFFDNLDARGVLDLLGSAGAAESAVALSHGMGAALAGFIRSGDPAGPLGDWPAFTPDARATKILDATPRVEIDRLAGRLDFWTRQRGKAVPPLSTIGGSDA